MTVPHAYEVLSDVPLLSVKIIGSGKRETTIRITPTDPAITLKANWLHSIHTLRLEAADDVADGAAVDEIGGLTEAAKLVS